MREHGYHFEIRDNVALFISAFDDVIVKRFDGRTEKDRIEARYVYAPKQRVIHDLVNPAKSMQMPVVAVNVTGLTRDPKRVFNKLHGFNYPTRTTDPNRAALNSAYRAPLPIDINIDMSIIGRYQTDVEQIIQNFAVHCNPYITIAWKVPDDYDLTPIQEIRSVVEWDGNVSYDFPVDTHADDKIRFGADTSMVIKGWLFHANRDNPTGTIHYVNANFYNTKALSSVNGLTTDDNYRRLSAGPYEYSEGLTSITEVETAGISGYTEVTDVLHSLSGKGKVQAIFSDITFPAGSAKDIVILYGKRFDFTDRVYLSSADTNLYGTLTASRPFSRFPTFSGAPLPESAIDIVTDNVMRVTIPTLTASSKFDLIIQSDIGWSSTYQSMSGHFNKTA
tara:strand:- start:2148 stop:3323 length:1176 start_codon:yes stop_codon:yes gene_type:complete